MFEKRGISRGDKKLGKVSCLLACMVLFVALSGPAAPGAIVNSANGISSPGGLAPTDVSGLARLTIGENAQILGRGLSAKQRNEAIPITSGPVEQVGAFSYIDSSSANFDTAVRCLSQAIYYEAANEPLAGKRAVAQVVLNRVRHPAYPSSVCDVVYEGWNAPVCQFSFVCDGSLERVPLRAKWNQSRSVAEAALAGNVETSVGTATHYHADYVLPRWAYEMAKVRRIGQHLFYRFNGRGGRAGSFTARWNGVERIPSTNLALLDSENAQTDLDSQATAPDPFVRRDPTDRRAENDVGGRLDPSKGWRLKIPDPTSASSGYDESTRDQYRRQSLELAGDRLVRKGEPS